MEFLVRASSPLIRVAVLVMSFGMLFGFSTASIAGVLESMSRDLSLGSFSAGVLVASLVFGCLVGSIAAGYLSGAIGRRAALLASIMLALPGFALMYVSPGFSGLFCARFLVGLGVGISAMVTPMYAAEVTPARHRGAIVSIFQLAITAGIMLAYGVTLVFDQSSWSTILASGALILALCLTSTLMLPESPRWLLTRVSEASARSAALRLGILDEISLTRHGAGGSHRNVDWRILRRGSTFAVLALCSVLFILQNLSGIDGILYYAPTIFKELGFSAGTASLAATFGLGVANFVATAIALHLVESAGRRPLLIWGSVAMVAGLGLTIAGNGLNLPWLGLGGLVVYIIAFAVSLGPLPYVLMSELFPSTIREQGIAAASATSWLFNALIALGFLSLVENAGLNGALLLFFVVCIISCVVAVLFVPETRGTQLEDIEEKVLAGQPLRRLGR